MNAPQNLTPNLPALIEALPGDPGSGPGASSRAPQTEFTRERQVAFLLALSECGAARRAARAAGVSHQSAYRMRRACAAFRRAWDAALIVARVHAEDVLATRALEGVEEAVFYHGEVVATRRRYDSRLLLAHLGRLDKLTENAAASAFAEDFDAALERFAQGSDTPERAPPTPDSFEPAENASGQCNTRSMSPGQSRAERPGEPEPCPDCGGGCLGPEEALTHEDCRSYDYRMERMYEARPEEAPWPVEFAGHDEEAVEAIQIEAFEEGVEKWWLVVPPHPNESPRGGAGGWVYGEASPESGLFTKTSAAQGNICSARA